MFNQFQRKIPTNIITGFLGVGKTTLIRQWLATKPANERWAVLVNEFGEVGIDGAFFKGQSDSGIYVKDVPGGCMCCTSGLPMQIALNQLITHAKPDRLLIEPTGLGHPKEIIAGLMEPHYQQVLQLQATITLVDARRLAEPRYREHEPFLEQLAMADQIVAAKADQYEDADWQRLKDYLAEKGRAELTPHACEHGVLDPAILSNPCQHRLLSQTHEARQPLTSENDIQQTLQQQGWVKLENQSDGFYSHGWIIAPEYVFDFHTVMMTLSGIVAERIKAVFITDQGIFAFNQADGALSAFEMDETADSRLEFICDNPTEAADIASKLEDYLFAPVLSAK